MVNASNSYQHQSRTAAVANNNLVVFSGDADDEVNDIVVSNQQSQQHGNKAFKKVMAGLLFVGLWFALSSGKFKISSSSSSASSSIQVWTEPVILGGTISSNNDPKLSMLGKKSHQLKPTAADNESIDDDYHSNIVIPKHGENFANDDDLRPREHVHTHTHTYEHGRTYDDDDDDDDSIGDDYHSTVTIPKHSENGASDDDLPHEHVHTHTHTYEHGRAFDDDDDSTGDDYHSTITIPKLSENGASDDDLPHEHVHTHTHTYEHGRTFDDDDDDNTLQPTHKHHKHGGT
jgi:hypothetical protein